MAKSEKNDVMWKYYFKSNNVGSNIFCPRDRSTVKCENNILVLIFYKIIIVGTLALHSYGIMSHTLISIKVINNL